MKHIFSSLTLVAIVVVAAEVPAQEIRIGQELTARRERAVGNALRGVPTASDVPSVAKHSSPPRTSAERPGFTIIRGQEPAITGQELVAQAAKRLANERQISAEMRYKIDAYGHELLGTGKYLQQGAGDDRLVRLDLRMQVGERPATLLEIRGSELYWLRRDIPPAPATLERLNLVQLRKSLTSTPDQAEAVLPQGGWIVLGGLPRLLAAIETNFAFAAPRAEEVQYQAADGKSVEKLPIWVVAGEWKPERLAMLTGRDPAKRGLLPDQLPDRIEVVLGRTTDLLPLFPFRITYRRTPPPNSQSTAPPPGPRDLLTLELFNVSSTRPIDPREFLYHPSAGDVDARDVTTAYIQRLGGEVKLR